MRKQRRLMQALPVFYGGMALCATIVRADNCSGPSDCQAAPANIDWTTALGISGVLILIGWRLFSSRPTNRGGRPGVTGGLAHPQAVSPPGQSPYPLSASPADTPGSPLGGALADSPDAAWQYQQGGYAVSPSDSPLGTHPEGQQSAFSAGPPGVGEAPAVGGFSDALAGAQSSSPPSAHEGLGSDRPPGAFLAQPVSAPGDLPPTAPGPPAPADEAIPLGASPPSAVSALFSGDRPDDRREGAQQPVDVPLPPSHEAPGAMNVAGQEGVQGVATPADTAPTASQPDRAHEGIPGPPGIPTGYEAAQSEGPPGVASYEPLGTVSPTSAAPADAQPSPIWQPGAPPATPPPGLAPIAAARDSVTTISFTYSDIEVAPNVQWPPGFTYTVNAGAVTFVLGNGGAATHAFALIAPDGSVLGNTWVAARTTATVPLNLLRGTYRLTFDLPSGGREILIVV